MDTLSSELRNLNCAGFSFHETESWTESSYFKKIDKKGKEKQQQNTGEKDSKGSQQANSKMGDFGEKKKIPKFLGKINVHKGKKTERKKQQEKKI